MSQKHDTIDTNFPFFFFLFVVERQAIMFHYLNFSSHFNILKNPLADTLGK